MGKFVCCENPITNLTDEVWIRLDTLNPSNSIVAADLNNVVWDSLTINNFSAYSPLGDFTPFKGQDPSNINVVLVDVKFKVKDSLTQVQRYAIPQGTRVITKENASIVEIVAIGVADTIDSSLTLGLGKAKVNTMSMTGIPTTPINLLFTFDLSEE